jgi:hypothetical protein
MANAASNYLENALLNHVLTGTGYTQPSTRYLALFNGTASTILTNLEAGTLTNEVSTGSYARTVITFGAAASGSITNSNTVTFPTATANYASTVTCIAVMDTSTIAGGNVLFYGELTQSKTVTTGDTFQVSPYNLTISLS